MPSMCALATRSEAAYPCLPLVSRLSPESTTCLLVRTSRLYAGAAIALGQSMHVAAGIKCRFQHIRKEASKALGSKIRSLLEIELEVPTDPCYYL